MYKSKLQELCQQKRWALPRYTFMKDGPDHIPRFKASVFLNGTSFHSSPSCKSCKEAQNDAAKSAFLHFTSPFSPAANSNPAQEVEIGLYKNLLQELTQREGITKPVYETMKCGVPHRPTFFSSVEVKGEFFHGKGQKSKKKAETNAAKVAYTVLTEHEPLKFMSTSDLVTAPENEDSSEKSSGLATAVENEEYAEERKKVSGNATTSADNSSSCSKPVPVSPEEVLLSSTSMHLDISALSISYSNMGKYPGSSSYLLNNRFRVYRCFPDIEFPKGIT